jgi:hypothetical protein
MNFRDPIDKWRGCFAKEERLVNSKASVLRKMIEVWEMPRDVSRGMLR